MHYFTSGAWLVTNACMQFNDLIPHYDGFIIDLWGVVHDGTALYPSAKAALAALHDAGKPVVFLSNAPRRASMAKENLDKLGIPESHYLSVITSGEVAYQQLQRDHGWLGTRYYYLGPGKDENIADGLEGYTRVFAPEEADFILNTGYEVDFQPHDEVLPLLRGLATLKLPLLCVNPDLEVVKQDGTHMLCAGTLAGAYEAMGGKVVYVGKPHEAVYRAAKTAIVGDGPTLGARITVLSETFAVTFGILGGIGKFIASLLGTVWNPSGPKLLAIGDNPLTDILGANRAGIDSLLITGGVLLHHHGELDELEARRISIKQGATPTYTGPRFGA